MGGNLYQQTTLVNGAPYAFQSHLPALGGFATGTYPIPGPQMGTPNGNPKWEQ